MCGSREPHQQQQEVPLEQLLHAVAKQGHKVPAGLQQQQKLLANISHLHLNGLQLTQLDSLRLCPQLQVQYTSAHADAACLIGAREPCVQILHHCSRHHGYAVQRYCGI